MKTKLLRTQVSLEDECRVFLKENYDIELNIPVKINNRLSRALGRFIVTRDNVNNRIEFAGFLLRDGADDQIISVLKHECIHYALYEQGRDYRDGQEDFENELKKHNSDSTNTLSVKKKDSNSGLSEDVSKILKDLDINIDKIINDKLKELYNN